MKQKLRINFFYIILFCLIAIQSKGQTQNSEVPEWILAKSQNHQQLIMADLAQTAAQADIDIKYYSIDIKADPTQETVEGEVLVVAQVIASSADRLELNFWDGMTVQNVYPGLDPNAELNYNRGNDLLNIDLGQTYSQGETIQVGIVYRGKPQGSLMGSFGFSTQNGQPMIWSFSQPWGARDWWPCKDVPSDKADSVDIRVTVPDGLIVASNGVLKQTTTEDGWTTFWWHEGYPIATFLVSLAAYPYEIHYDDYVYNSGADTMQIHFYTFPNKWNQYREINLKVKEMLAFFSDKFGEYPFVDEKYGHADFSVGGAIEHQTCSYFHFWNENLYAHELAHQWWGDAVTYSTWHDTWLGEGFATYAEALWHEHVNGAGTADDYLIARRTYLGEGTVYVEDPFTFTNIEDNPFYPPLVYYKASWVLHMLRHVVGDETFFNILRAWGDRFAHDSASSADFETVCEEVSGMNLDSFFHQWLHEEYFPRYAFDWQWTQNGGQYEIELNIVQMQQNHDFWMPIDINVETENDTVTFVVWDSLSSQTFHLTTDSEPLDITLDPDNWILKSVQEPLQNPTFDNGILLVNAVSFDDYGFEIRDAYNHHAFIKDFQFDFWDCFDPPFGGYPSPLPNPIGYGRIPNDVLENYSTVIWIAGYFGGDEAQWQQSAIWPYLKAGGNLILITRNAQDYIYFDTEEALGITWSDQFRYTIRNYNAVYPGLVDMEFLHDQNTISVFDTALVSDESVLLFEETWSFDEPRGLGVWNKPTGGGSHRPDGGQFVFLSGRPHRFYWEHLRENISFILTDFFGEVATGLQGSVVSSIPQKYTLEKNVPNPFNGETQIRFDIPERAEIHLAIYNMLGQQIRKLVDYEINPGRHHVHWDGTDDMGRDVASGIYIYRLTGNNISLHEKMIMMR